MTKILKQVQNDGFIINQLINNNLKIMSNLIEKINELKKKRNAIILAHNYQLPEVQDIADFVGDSLELAQIFAKIDAKVVVLCGVRFMAETAIMIDLKKKILLLDLIANCPMVEMIDAGKVREMKKQYLKATMVYYVNSTAEIKADSGKSVGNMSWYE